MIKWLFIFVQTIAYDRFLESMLPSSTKEFYLTDDSGYIWSCTNRLVRGKELEYKIGGRWKDFCLCRRLAYGVGIKIGAPRLGRNVFLFITLKF